MAEGNGEQGLVRADDFEGELEEHWQEASGLKVFDKHGDEVGTVEDIYVYAPAAAVHLVQAQVEDRSVLIPVDAVTTVGEEGIEVEQDKGTILDSPSYDSDEVPDAETSRAAYDHFGYPDQLTLLDED